MFHDERSCHQSGRPACPCMCNISIILWQIDDDIQVVSQTWMALSTLLVRWRIFTHLLLSTVKYNFMSVVKHNERFIRKKGLILKPTLFIPIAEKWISFSYQLQIIDYPINVNGVFTHHEFNVIKNHSNHQKLFCNIIHLFLISMNSK